MNKSKFLTGLLSFCPGLGHMYLGYMRRGASFMGLFFGIFFFTSLLSGVFGALAWLAPIVWCYSFFDALHLCGAIQMGRCSMPDRWLIYAVGSSENTSVREFVNRRHVMIGVAVIAAGVLSIYQMLLRPWLYDLVRYNDVWGPVFQPLVYNLSGIIISILLIALGIWLACGQKKAPQLEEDAEPDHFGEN